MSTNTNTDSTPSLSLHVSITVAPENVAAFFEALRPAYEGVIAEPECTFFQVFQNPEEPGVIKFVEDWNVTKEWFMTVQLQKEYYKPYLAITEPMFLKPREFEIWTRRPGNEWRYVKEATS